MSEMSKWGPRYTSIRDPRDSNKKFGMFWNWPRYLYFGGAPQGVTLNQSGNKAVKLEPTKNQRAVGPISDRGKGR